MIRSNTPWPGHNISVMTDDSERRDAWGWTLHCKISHHKGRWPTLSQTSCEYWFDLVFYRLGLLCFEAVSELRH
ncbi:hypothetical protein A0H81_08005 [Grifola frondosa]|uniref:Uncharacterized protein n=1 Tax=Grifola frondosa TaxID=5627 RepID=A0A1C7M688_GRIFR|nr:hypothetical protein A0H81_08005 [Grifola frondosa]